MVDEDGRAIRDLGQGMGRNDVLSGGVLAHPFHEVCLDAPGVVVDGPGAAADAGDQALAGQHLEVPVNRHRRHGEFARQLADRSASVPAYLGQDLETPQLGRWLVVHEQLALQTRSSYARFLISNLSGRNSSIAATRCSANRFSASLPLTAVDRNG